MAVLFTCPKNRIKVALAPKRLKNKIILFCCDILKKDKNLHISYQQHVRCHSAEQSRDIFHSPRLGHTPGTAWQSSPHWWCLKNLSFIWINSHRLFTKGKKIWDWVGRLRKSLTVLYLNLVLINIFDLKVLEIHLKGLNL